MPKSCPLFLLIVSCTLCIIVIQHCTKRSRAELEADLLRTVLGSFPGHITSPTTRAAWPGALHPGSTQLSKSSVLGKTLTTHLLNLLTNPPRFRCWSSHVSMFPGQCTERVSALAHSAGTMHLCPGSPHQHTHLHFGQGHTGCAPLSVVTAHLSLMRHNNHTHLFTLERGEDTPLS